MEATTAAHAQQQGLQTSASMQTHAAQEPPQQPAKRGKPAGAYLLISYCSQFAEGLGLADIRLSLATKKRIRIQTEKRKEQNRSNQRAFRQRRERVSLTEYYLLDLPLEPKANSKLELRLVCKRS